MRINNIPLLHTDIRGEGPTVVLLHGIFSSSKYWSKVADLLDVNYKVIAIDLLGFGNSPKPRNKKYDYQDHIESINATLEYIGVEGPFILIGHSMGSLIALRYSILYEDRVHRLLLINMPIMLGTREVRREILGSKKLYRIGLERGLHRLSWTIFRILYRLQMLPSRVRDTLRMNEYFFQHTAASRIGSFYNVIAKARVDTDLARVRVKTYMLSGLEDRQIYLSNLEYKISFGPQVQHITLPTGHHIPYKFPELVTQYIQK